MVLVYTKQECLLIRRKEMLSLQQEATNFRQIDYVFVCCLPSIILILLFLMFLLLPFPLIPLPPAICLQRSSVVSSGSAVVLSFFFSSFFSSCLLHFCLACLVHHVFPFSVSSSSPSSSSVSSCLFLLLLILLLWHVPVLYCRPLLFLIFPVLFSFACYSMCSIACLFSWVVCVLLAFVLLCFFFFFF